MSGTVTPIVLSPNSAGYSTDPLLDQEKVDVRRFLGYPAFGSAEIMSPSYRFFQQYGYMEFKLSNSAPDEYAQIRWYLAQLYPLEVAIITASANLDTAQASVWVHNKRELAERRGLYISVRRDLADFIGVPFLGARTRCRTI